MGLWHVITTFAFVELVQVRLMSGIYLKLDFWELKDRPYA